MHKGAFKLVGKVAIYILFPALFVSIPTSWLEKLPSFCLITAVTGVHCPGCGMTRALSCMSHGDVRKAIRYNKLVVIVFPLLCYAWGRKVFEIMINF